MKEKWIAIEEEHRKIKRAKEAKRKAELAIKEENRQKRKRMYEEMYEALGLL